MKTFLSLTRKTKRWAVVCILLLISSFHLFAQNNQWAWIGGDTTVNSSLKTNQPSARQNSTSWTDANGNLWLMGGDDGKGGYLNDLWKYSVSNKLWTFISGDNGTNNSGVYGTLGKAASTNKPGSRKNSLSWYDSKSNRLWLMGGNGYAANNVSGYLNDLWFYDILSGLWTWASGSNTTNAFGVYGTKNVAATSNIPGGRASSIGWVDNVKSELWLFGGTGYSTGSIFGYFNDMWKYSIGSSQWTWVSGDNTINNLGLYGTAADKPGARENSISWYDPLGNNFWLMGGEGYAASGNSPGYLNDLWKYNNGQWTWVSGDKTTNSLGNFGAKGVAASTNKPSSRMGSISWTDLIGNLWLFGGLGNSQGSNPGFLNDLWEYANGNWIWVGGDNSVPQSTAGGVYGTIGQATVNNKPGARSSSISWADASGNFWLMGGDGYDAKGIIGVLNDLWEYSKPLNQDSLVLVNLYNHTGGGNWTHRDNWLVPGKTINTWYGVTAPDSISVTSLDLNTNNLTLQIPDSLGYLSKPQILNLGYNHLTGKISDSLGKLTNLTSLTLTTNKLSGSIPSSLGNLIKLTHLALDGANPLTGSLPPALGNLSKLQDLWLGSDSLSGKIPLEVANLPNLITLNIAQNHFVGPLPHFVAASKFNDIELDHNNFVFDAGIEDLVSNHRGNAVLIYDNQASVHLYPYGTDQYYVKATDSADNSFKHLSVIWSLDNVQQGTAITGDTVSPHFTTSQNGKKISATVTNSIATGLTLISDTLIVAINNAKPSTNRDSLVLASLYRATGGDNWTNHNNWLIPGKYITTWFGITATNDSTVTGIDLSINQPGSTIITGNNLTRSIPDSLGYLPNLQNLNLSSNLLTGKISDSLCLLSNLQTLNLRYNNFSGKIPSNIGNLTNLTQLILTNNGGGGIRTTTGLTDSIPSSIGKLTNLVQLYLDYNSLSDTLPGSISKLTKLQKLALGGNELSGNITMLGNLTNLIAFVIFHNHFNGPIPIALGNLNASAIKANGFNITNNKFVFDGGLEAAAKNYNGGDLQYSPQDSVPLNISISNQYSVTAIASSPPNDNSVQNDTFFWYKNNALIATVLGKSQADTIAPTLFTSSLKNGDTIYAKITSSVSKGLTLYSKRVIVSNINPQPPTITSFTPANGCANATVVTITGTNFTGVTAVTFGGTAAKSFTVVSSTHITAIPATGTIKGSIIVTTGAGTAPSSGNFTVNPPDVTNVTITNNSPHGFVCPNSSVVFTASPTNGGSSPTFQWLRNGVPIPLVTNSTLSLSGTQVADGVKVVCIMTSSDSCASGTATDSVIINSKDTFHTTLTVNPSNNITSGNNVTFTGSINVTGTVALYTYFFYVNDKVINVGQDSTNSISFNYPTDSIKDKDKVYCTTMKGAGTNTCRSIDTSNIITMYVTTTPCTHNVQISPSPAGAICFGDTVKFTAIPTNGGNALYQWRVNRINYGIKSIDPILTINTLKAGDSVSCIMTSSMPCAGGASDTSNAIAMTVSNKLTPTVKITSNPSGTICQGQSVSFVATPDSINGQTPKYQWQINGTDVKNSIGSTFTAINPNDKDAVTCVITVGNISPCTGTATATSAPYQIPVSSGLQPTITVMPSRTGSICAGDSITFTAKTTNVVGTPQYQWLVGGKIPSVISNAVTFTTNALKNNDSVTCTITVGNTAPCTGNIIVPSLNYVATVITPTAPPITVVPSRTSICAGDNVTFTAQSTSVGTFQWLVGGKIPSSGISNASTFTTNALKNKDSVSCVLTVNNVSPCTGTIADTSNLIGMVVDTIAKPTFQISPSGTNGTDSICPSTILKFHAINIKNPGSSPVYQWQLNGAPVTVNGNDTTYTPSSPLKSGDYVSCILTSSLPCTSPFTSNKTTIAIITPTLSLAISSSPAANSICTNNKVTFTAVATPDTGITSTKYQWTKKINALGTVDTVGTNSKTYIDSTLATGDVITCTLTGILACSTNLTAVNSVTIKVLPGPIVDAGPDQTILAGTSAQLHATATGSNIQTYRYIWQPPQSLNLDNILTPIATPTKTQLYKLTAISSQTGCPAQDSVTVKVLPKVEVPNVFTPNGDGQHDTWEIPTLKDYLGCTVDIFDRDGHKIYSSVNYNIPWDGTYNGKKLPVATYYYIINLKKDTPPIAGSVTILR